MWDFQWLCLVILNFWLVLTNDPPLFQPLFICLTNLLYIFRYFKSCVLVSFTIWTEITKRFLEQKQSFFPMLLFTMYTSFKEIILQNFQVRVHAMYTYIKPFQKPHIYLVLFHFSTRNSFFLFCNWDSIHARLNSHYEA